jgi:hypothetical protein
MTQLTFGYSDSEDRIWLSSTDGKRYWLTRRLVKGLLKPVCDLLEKTVPGGGIPNELPPAQRVALEHEEAMADTPEGQPALEKNKETRPASHNGPITPPALITSLTFNASATHCSLIITAGQPPTSIDLNRIDFHRLLGALYKITVTANWDITGQPSWLTT